MVKVAIFYQERGYNMSILSILKIAHISRGVPSILSLRCDDAFARVYHTPANLILRFISSTKYHILWYHKEEAWVTKGNGACE